MTRPVRGGTVAAIERVTGQPVAHAEDHLHRRAADEREASAFGLPVGSAILAGAYIWADAAGSVLEYGEFCLPPRRTLRYEHDVEPGSAP